MFVFVFVFVFVLRYLGGGKVCAAAEKDRVAASGTASRGPRCFFAKSEARGGEKHDLGKVLQKAWSRPNGFISLTTAIARSSHLNPIVKENLQKVQSPPNFSFASAAVPLSLSLTSTKALYPIVKENNLDPIFRLPLSLSSTKASILCVSVCVCVWGGGACKKFAPLLICWSVWRPLSSFLNPMTASFRLSMPSLRLILHPDADKSFVSVFTQGSSI